jgi:hypothetical protein
MEEMKTFYFTFGQMHTHPKTGEPMKDHWIEIVAPSEGAARDKMYELFGVKWSFQYDEQNFDTSYFIKGCHSRITCE